MARKILLETGYAFNPSTRTVVIPKIVPRERLALITNVTSNKVIYNFSDPSLLATSYATLGESSVFYQVTTSSGTGTVATYTTSAAHGFIIGQTVTISGVTPYAYNIVGTITSVPSTTTFTVATNAAGTYVSGGLVSINENTVVTLNYNTTAMATTDKLQITIDEYAEKIEPSAELTDPVGKFRTSTPQALVDTDFEYSSQVSKWENLGLMNNRPFAYAYVFNSLNTLDIQTGAAGTRTITVYTNASLVTTTSAGAAGNGTTAQYTTSAAHNLSVGQLVTVTGITAASGTYSTTIPTPVLSVPTSTSFIIASGGTGAATGTGNVVYNIAPTPGTPLVVVDTFSATAIGNYIVETTPAASITAISAGTGTQVTYSTTTPPPIGSAVVITGATTAGANGTFIVQSIVAGTSFTVNNTTTSITTSTASASIISALTYSAKGPTPTAWASTSIFDTYKTQIQAGTFYTNAAITAGTATAPTMSYNTNTGAVTVTTTASHGLALGNEIAVVGVTGLSGTINGNYYVATINSPTQFIYYAAAAQTGTLSASPTATTSTGAAGSNIITVASATGLSINMTAYAATGIPNGTIIKDIQGLVVTLSNNLTAALSTTSTTFYASIFARSQAQVTHRAFDGGVMFSTNSGSNNVTQVRQTRRYFRYQSGKGIQISSGTILKPTFGIDSLTSSATVVTVQTKERHNLQPGYQVTIYGANENGYNGTFTVTNVTSLNTFTYTSSVTPQTTTASGQYYVSVNAWNGAYNRLGMFDQQNGVFFEFDGQTLYVVRRNSIFQTAGRVTVTQGSNTVTQTSTAYPTSFNKQLVPGDFIILRGQSYKVIDIASDTSLSIQPAYRGNTATNVIVSKTAEIRIPQSAWNIDKLDGTGPSGYNLDLTKMQMFYIDYSWYGAGAVRWGFRGPKGNIIYVHKLANNNQNAMAYMRSGNLPGRYESETKPAATQIQASVGTADTTITVANTSGFYAGSATLPGTAVIRSATAYEFFNYTGITGNTFTGVTRAQAGNLTTSGYTLTIAAGANTGTVVANTGLQVGQRVVHPSLPDGTKIETISGTTLTLSAAATTANPLVYFPPMGATAGTAFTYSATTPVVVEQAFPTFGPTMSHWGTSVIMDGRFDDDKSLLFTYGQTTATALAPALGTTATGSTSGSSTSVTLSAANTNVVAGMYVSGTGVAVNTYVASVQSSTAITLNNAVSLSSVALTFSGATTKALFSIRIAPSVDTGIADFFGRRELINRMQLVFKTLDISLLGTTSGNVFVQAILNGVPYNPTGSTYSTWTNPVRNAVSSPTSSLAQIADFAGGNYIIQGGETTGGFFVSTTGSNDIGTLRDLGNAVIGNGTLYSNSNIYPDGPDVLTIVVTNVGNASQSVLGRVAWTEAQA
jgi:hypothetical protein